MQFYCHNLSNCISFIFLSVRVHAASGLQTPILMDNVYGADMMVPTDAETILEMLDTVRERFFLHAASLSIPRFGVSVSAPEPSFWKEILDLFDWDM